MGNVLDLTDEEIEQQVRSILSFRKGKANAISLWEIVERVFGREAAANRGNNNSYGRKVRDVIAKYRESDLIVSSSKFNGYWLAEDMADIELIAEEYDKRAKDMLAKASTLRKRGSETFGPQLPLL